MPDSAIMEDDQGRAATRAAPAADAQLSHGAVRSLTVWLGVAGPVYLITSVLQGLFRPGFDFSRHDWSLLANGPFGWIQVLNLILTGVMVIIGAVGVPMIIGTATRAERWLPRLLAAYGVGLVLAGIFTADPADGFPIGTPAGRPTGVSWHAMVHLVAGGLGFASLIAACLVTAALHRRQGARGKAWIDTAVGILFGLAFLGIATGSTSPLIVLGFTAGIVISFGWLTWLALELTGFRAGNRRD